MTASVLKGGYKVGFHDLLISACEQVPERTLVHSEGGSTSFSEHLSRVLRAAGCLRSGFGLGPADRFAVLSRNSTDYLELLHAALLGAAIIVPLNVRSSELELTAVLNDSGCRVCFASSEFVGVANRIKGLTALEEVIEIGPECPAADYRDRVNAAIPLMPAVPAPRDTAFIMYTSGTTGRAKGVVIQHGALANDIYKCAMPTNLTQGYTFLLHAPLFHIASVRGFGLAPAAGATLVLLPRFDPRRIVHAIKSHNVTTTSFIATTVRDMLELPEFCGEILPSLTSIGYGSAPMSPSVLEQLMAAFPAAEFVNWYGLTETCGHVCTLTGDDHRNGGVHLKSVGRPLPGNRVRIVDQDGRVQPRGTSGEIAVAGDNLMAGYWNQPGLTCDADGSIWHRTGDAGYLDNGGYLYLAGRARDMIITGGENVVPSEVEAVLADYPHVSQAVVMGVPDDKWGEAVHACVSVHDGALVDEAELRDHCRSQVAGYKVPKRIEIRRTPFPMTGSHKIDRKQLITDYRDRIAMQDS